MRENRVGACSSKRIRTAVQPPSFVHGQSYSCLFFHQQHFLRVVNLSQFDLDHFVHRGLHVAADEGGLDGNLAMSAVNQHAELHAPRPPVLKERIERGAGSAAGEQNIVYHHDVLFLDLKPNLFLLHHGLRPQGREIVAIEGDIERSDGDLGILDAGDDLAQPLGQGHAAAANSDQPQGVDASVLFHDLICQPHQRALNFRCGHELCFLTQARLAGRILCIHGYVCLVSYENRLINVDNWLAQVKRSEAGGNVSVGWSDGLRCRASLDRTAEGGRPHDVRRWTCW
ncbi:hypothetical protein SBA1_180006 [Candidatus Sulfotelmatobacter kueseliae]|uniref:Uncharacterized protein n=1 Tax=Candidatus Sulfotelmatobacter kueseliae TaxID=2042962 RepID=A0A2U3KCM1_9BACT|nr:hypothetical protein SBA1_180006 [Candidatus Sulfotelmatobacter kueseliae]